jgi:hypothetical protein
MCRKANCLFSLLACLVLTCCLARPGSGQDSKFTSVRTQVLLQGISPSAPPQPITVYIYDEIGYLLRTAIVRSGDYITLRLPPGVYPITFRGEKWLGHRVIVNTSEKRREQAVLLLTGDANGDNQVDWDDMNILAETYQTHEQSRDWDSRADFDCDGDVDDTDADLLCNNLFFYGD